MIWRDGEELLMFEVVHLPLHLVLVVLLMLVFYCNRMQRMKRFYLFGTLVSCLQSKYSDTQDRLNGVEIFFDYSIS